MSVSFSNTLKIFENSNLYYLITVNLDGKYAYANHKYNKTFEAFYGSMVGLPYEITMHPEDVEVCKRVSEKCFQNPENIFPATIRKHDGKGGYVFTQWEYKAMLNSQGEPEGVFCLGYDITEFQNKNNLLTKALKTVDQQKYILHEIAFYQSHTIRKPVANILGLGQVLENMDMDPDVYKIVRHIVQSAKELDHAIQSIDIKYP